MRFAVGVEYDGRRYCGWQRQLGTATVQQSIEEALSRVANGPITIVTAGRTDTGVHANGQVFHFDTSVERDEQAWLRGGNTFLAKDIALVWVRRVSSEFHARFSAVSRCYRYIVFNRRIRPALYTGRVAWEYRTLAVEPMQRAAQDLIGEHDFSAFRAAGCQAQSPVRTVYALFVGHSGDWYWFDVRANAFLQHMVRNMVGLLLAIGAGEQRDTWAREVLGSRDRRRGGVTAPPDGLYLNAVEYPARFQLPAPAPACRFW
ncbi:MAG: tRNA pseudouridine(38-40) synthase TruA [Gammaproteobacteria bacterium]|nr:tRNA pseudouridine(38-40) synthase TruA [Gammaproteobacteria bacterium]